MVRLKVFNVIITKEVIVFQFLMVRLKGNLQFIILSLQQFQFLMVRLKALSQRRQSNGNRISIPYGSIKRYYRPLQRTPVW